MLMPMPVSATPASTAREVAALSAREMLRSRFTVAVILLSFALMLALFIGLDFAFTAPEARGNLVRENLGAIAAMGMMAIAFAGTAVPLVSYRERGTYRLLGATPIRRSTFLLGQLPIRAAIAGTELLAIFGVLSALGAAGSDYLVVFIAAVCGFGMFLGLGMLLGARGRNTDLVTQVSLLLPIIVIFTSGIGIPTTLLPDWAQAIIHALPTTWYMDSLNHWTAPDTALWPHLGGMLAIAALSLIAAAACFDWGKEMGCAGLASEGGWR